LYGLKLADGTSEAYVPLVRHVMFVTLINKCNLVASQFTDEITIVLDQLGNVLDIDYATPNSCTKEDVAALQLPTKATWHTSVRIRRPREGAR
jgi:hypothetical protein